MAIALPKNSRQLGRIMPKLLPVRVSQTTLTPWRRTMDATAKIRLNGACLSTICFVPRNNVCYSPFWIIFQPRTMRGYWDPLMP